ncbi:unnamed protein product [Lathyrus sativus]|nr:unnamed protein product [Lathyrus sativus]
MQKSTAIPLPVLPEELIGEILLSLPVRSLLQFKCVCKSWKTLISSSQFVKSHLQISTADRTLTNQAWVFSITRGPRNTVSYPLKQLFENPAATVKRGTSFYTEVKSYCIIGSCNGLLCLLHCLPRCVRLCNPSLRMISKTSSVPVSRNWFIKPYGFGYDQVNDNYKALLVVQSNKHYHQILTKIYTFGQDDSWKTIPNFPYNDTMRTGKFVSGTLNWIVSSKNKILSFDIETETYMELLLPQNDGHNIVYKHSALSVLSDHLCLSHSDNCDWVLWMMKEYGVVESWTKFIVVSYDKLLQNNPCMVELMFISQNGILMVLIHNYELIVYNTNTGVAFRTMKRVRYPCFHCESLVSLPC